VLLYDKTPSDNELVVDGCKCNNVESASADPERAAQGHTRHKNE